LSTKREKHTRPTYHQSEDMATKRQAGRIRLGKQKQERENPCIITYSPKSKNPAVMPSGQNGWIL